ncbi:MAG: PfkB family carbohydrate kinase [Pseudanabaenaceae cyanobacterium bins.68]|nr:PfkB family carbohydrate kinase [Pseudanabaenaceae cyanobacterium bins.68]
MVNLEFAQALPQLTELVGQFSQQRILVVGDLTLDEFVTGEVERLSREAPVLIVRHEHTVQVPGGGANAIYNLAKLGAQVIAVGIVGDDPQGQALKQIFRQAGIDVTGVFTDPSRPTVTKTRISAHARQSVTQQIVRLDRKSDQVPPSLVQTQIAEYIARHMAMVDGVVCSDYGEGVMQPGVIAAALKHRLVVVDTQKQLERYRGASIFTPNLPEAELAVGYQITEANLGRAGQELLALTQAQQILITRGEDGMSLFDRQGNHDHVPAFNRTQVFDVTGAGDTVVAALTLGLAAGGDAWQGMVLGNLAASIVVRQFGTSTTNSEQLLAAIATLALQ